MPKCLICGSITAIYRPDGSIKCATCDKKISKDIGTKIKGKNCKGMHKKRF